MANTYVVTEGDYSDYRIVAIFSEEYSELAQKLAENIYGQVEIYVLNPHVAFPKFPRWKILMSRDGDTLDCAISSESAEKPVNTCNVSELKPTYWCIDNHAPYNLEVGCFAKSREHAIKITNEYRTRLIALGIYDHVINGKTYRNFTDQRDVQDVVKDILNSIDEESL